MTKSDFSAKEKDTVAEVDELWEGEGATLTSTKRFKCNSWPKYNQSLIGKFLLIRPQTD
jgi:hypothetical protein